MIATACTYTTDEFDAGVNVVGGRKIESFTGSIDNGEPQNRTTSVATGANKIMMLWHADDKIAVTDRLHFAKYDLTEGENSTYGKFALSEESDGVSFGEGAPIYGVVPFSAVDLGPQLPELELEKGEGWGVTRAEKETEEETGMMATKGRLSIYIPTVQSFSNEESDNVHDRNIMVGKFVLNEEGAYECDFKKVASLVRFSITLPELSAEQGKHTVYQAKIIAEGVNIAGRCFVDTDSDDIRILEARRNEITLNYLNPVTAPNAEGWAIIAPVDFSKCERVFYEIYTNKGIYTFCKKPKNFEVGYIYNLPLDTQQKFKLNETATSAGDLKDGEYLFDDSIVTGTILYSDGTPAVGVSVSDGFTVVTTDESGKYSLRPSIDTYYIYYSIPADCVVPQDAQRDNQPAFFTRYDEKQKVYNFTLEKLPGGVEEQFSLFVIADPQVRNEDELGYFRNETVVGMNAHKATKSVPCYAVTLGDIVYSEYGGRAGAPNTEPLMPDMRSKIGQIDMPVFQTIGNHDYTYFDPTSPIDSNKWQGSSDQIRVQRAFEDVFGPINYSWNRGDVHIVHMRNVYFEETGRLTDDGAFRLGFTDEQVEWLRQDLAAVPDGKMVILCVHIPIWGRHDDTVDGLYKYPNVMEVIDLLKEKTGTNNPTNRQIFSGHNHYNRHYYGKGTTNTPEHSVAAACGVWWSSNINGDGSPNGYAVYDFNGATISDSYYMGVNEGMNDQNYQIRLYRGNAKYGTRSGYYQTQYGENVILANVFNGYATDPKKAWTVKVYEDDVYTGDMTLIPEKIYSPSSSQASGKYIAFATSVGVNVPNDSMQDWWAIAYRICCVGTRSASSFPACYHMYRYTLTNPNATNIRVVATDPYDNKYSTDEFIGNYDEDYTYVKGDRILSY